MKLLLHLIGPAPSQFPDQLDFQFTQFPVGDDQEIAAATGRIEELHLAQPLLKGFQFRAAVTVLARPEAVELRPQVVENSGSITFRMFFSVV